MISPDSPLPVPGPDETWVVGAVVLDARGRAFAQRRSGHRRLFPGCWDIVGGHVDPGESLHGALAPEIAEETGWRPRRVVRVLAEHSWSGRREVDVFAEAPLPDGYVCCGDGPLGADGFFARLDRDRGLRWIVVSTCSNPFTRATVAGTRATFVSELGRTVTVDLDDPAFR